MHPARPVRRHASLVAVLVALVLAGCSASEAGSGDASRGSTPPGSTSRGGATAPARAAGPPVLTADPSSGNIDCVARVDEPMSVVLYQPTASATGDLILTGATVRGSGVRFIEAEGVVVTARLSSGPVALVGHAWPVKRDEALVVKTDLPRRTSLVGMEVRDGQRILPLIHFEAVPGARLVGIGLEYTDAAGHAGKVTLPIRTRFARGAC